MKRMDKKGELVHNAIKRNELVKLPLEVYWSIAFAPLYQLINMHIDRQGHWRKGKFLARRQDDESDPETCAEGRVEALEFENVVFNELKMPG